MLDIDGLSVAYGGLQALSGLSTGTFIPLTISFVLRNLQPRYWSFGIAAYALSGLLAGFSGFLLTGYVGQAFLGLGNAYVLTSIVTAAIGGVALAGGRAPYAGVAAAAIMLTVLVSLLTALNIGEAGRQVTFGATLLAFLALDRIVARPGRT